jgi:NAD(P)-dependent dehydrogenase (short-subunit alcohol dehydrogenase family)
MKPTLVVLGATGRVGRGVVAAAVAQGRPVIAVARQTRELQQLREAHTGADLAIVRGSVADDVRSARLVQSLRRLERPLAGIVVAICGDCERGRVLDRPGATLRRTLDQNLGAHASAARHLLPLLAESGRAGSYVLVGGPGGDQPWAGYGHRSIVSASLRMLARVLHEEARALAVRVHLLAVDLPLRDASNAAHACECWPTPEAIGRRALQLLDTHSASGPRAVVRYTAANDVRALLDSLLPSPIEG